MLTILWIVKKPEITRPARIKNTKRVQMDTRIHSVTPSPEDAERPHAQPFISVHCNNIDVANKVDAVLSTRLISHIALTMIIEAAGGGEGFCEIWSNIW
jgi:hypothetical protein